MQVSFNAIAGLSARLLLAVTVAAPLQAAAGRVIEVGIVDHTGATPQQGRALARLEGGRIRIDVPPPAGRPDTVIYLPETHLLLHLDGSRKKFMEFDTRLLGSAGEAARSFRQLVDEALAVFKRQPDKPAGSVDVRAGGVETISGLPCRKFVVTKDGNKIQEIWATSWRNVDLERGQASALRQLASYYDNLATALAGIPFFEDMQQFHLGAVIDIDAFPVLIRYYTGGRPAITVRMNRPRRESVPDSAFGVPAGYLKQQPWQAGALGR